MKKILIALLILMATPAFAFGPAIQAVISTGSTSCSASYGAEQLTTANATDDGGGNEADATTGWTSVGLLTFDSIDTFPNAGTYHLTLVANSSLDRGYRVFSLSTGTVYKLSSYIRHNGTGGDWRCYLARSTGSTATHIPITPLVTSSDTTYVNYGFYTYTNVDQDTFLCQENSATDDGGIYIDNVSMKQATLCYGNELYTTSNALSLSGDANATTGITAGGYSTFEVLDSGGADGTYYLHFVANASLGAFYIDLSGILSIGQKYLISFKAKHSGTGDAAACGFEAGTTISPTAGESYVEISPTTTSWAQFGHSFVYSAAYRYWGCAESGTSNNSDFYVDSLTIKEVTGE